MGTAFSLGAFEAVRGWPVQGSSPLNKTPPASFDENLPVSVPWPDTAGITKCPVHHWAI